jgi:hypothetical protein
LFLIIASALYLVLLTEPLGSRWTNFVLGAGLMIVGFLNLRNANRQLLDIEGEDGAGAGSDEELRARNGL